MPGRKKRTNRVLILITVLLCLASGTIFTQSSSAVEPKSNQDTLPNIIVADDADTADKELSSEKESKKPLKKNLKRSPSLKNKTQK